MNEIEKILELLDKATLNDEEKQYLSDALEDNDNRKIKDIYLQLKNSLSSNDHIDEELMAKYVLYKNNISSEKIIRLLSAKIEDHIHSCAVCQDLYKELNSEYLNVDDFINKTIDPKPNERKNIDSVYLNTMFKFNKFRYIFISLASLAIIYFGLSFISSVTTPDYKKSFLDSKDFYTTRGRTTESFQRGLDAIDNGNYNNAILYLKEDIKANVDDESIFYSYFILGITYVNMAERDYLGLFKSYNKDDVIKGIENFNKSIELNKSGKFNNLNLDAHYYIAKAYLLIDDNNSARKHLKFVIDGKGSYYKKAEELLKLL